MFNRLRGKSPIRDEKKESFEDSSSNNDHLQPPAPPYTAAGLSILQSEKAVPFQTRFASLSMYRDDRLHFLRFPPEAIDACRAAIIRSWPEGIQEERPYASAHEIKLESYPWLGQGKDSANARRLINSVLAVLHGLGWILTLNTDLSKAVKDKDSLIFRHQDPLPQECDWCCMSFSWSDRLRFIDAPRDMYCSIPSRIDPQWFKDEAEYAPGVWEMRLHGSPWKPYGKDAVQVGEMILTILEILEEEGWSVYASIDQKAKSSDDSRETDTWHLCRPKRWVKGAPVYHH